MNITGRDEIPFPAPWVALSEENPAKNSARPGGEVVAVTGDVSTEFIFR
jgi:hypothetical protein